MVLETIQGRRDKSKLKLWYKLASMSVPLKSWACGGYAAWAQKWYVFYLIYPNLFA